MTNFVNPFSIDCELYNLFNHIEKTVGKILSYEPVYIHETSDQSSELFVLNNKILYVAKSFKVSNNTPAAQMAFGINDEGGETINFSAEQVFSFVSTRYSNNMELNNFIFAQLDNWTNIESYFFNGYIITIK
jgi:hypothetical protein